MAGTIHLLKHGAIRPYCINQPPRVSDRLHRAAWCDCENGRLKQSWAKARRPIEDNHDKDTLKSTITSQLEPLLNSMHEIRLATAQLAGRLEITEATDLLKTALRDETREGSERAGALFALSTISPTDMREIVDQAIEDDSAEVRAAGRIALANIDEEAAVPVAALEVDQRQ